MNDLDNAILSHKSGVLSDAINHYERFLFVNPTHADALRLYGTALMQLSQFERAESALAKATKLDPNNVLGWSNLGIVQMQRSRWLLATQAFEQAITRHPQASFYSNMGLALQRLNKHNQAIESFQTALKLEPENTNYILNLAVCYRKNNRVNQALSILETAKTITVELANEMGLCRLESNQYDAAISHFQHANELNSLWGPAWCNLGMTFRLMGQLKQSRIALDKAFECHPTDPLNFLQLAMTLDAQGHEAAAYGTIEEGLRIAPNQINLSAPFCPHVEQKKPRNQSHRDDKTRFKSGPQASRRLASTRSQSMTLGREDEALNAYKRANAIDPNNPEIAHFFKLHDKRLQTRASQSYIEKVFDNYAATFDQELVDPYPIRPLPCSEQPTMNMSANQSKRLLT